MPVPLSVIVPTSIPRRYFFYERCRFRLMDTERHRFHIRHHRHQPVVGEGNSKASDDEIDHRYATW